MHVNFSTNRTVQSKPMKPWQGILFGLIFVIIGIAVLIFAVSSIKTYNEKNKTFVEITSRVVDYKYDDEGLQAIVVEYVVDGQTYQKISNTYSNMPKSIGTEVSIKYNPNNPRDAIWTTDSTNIILPIFGAVFTLVGFFVIISNVKNTKKQNQLEEQFVEQANGLYNNVDIQSQQNISNQQLNNANQLLMSGINQQAAQPIPNINQAQMNGINQQTAQPMPNINQAQMNGINQQTVQPMPNINQAQMNGINQQAAQPMPNINQAQMNGINQQNSNIDVNNLKY